MEILLLQSKKIDRMQSEIEELQRELEKKDLKISESGSTAEASIRINNVFADAEYSGKRLRQSVKK